MEMPKQSRSNRTIVMQFLDCPSPMPIIRWCISHSFPNSPKHPPDRQPHRHPPHLRLGNVHLRRLRRHPRLLHGNATQIRPHLHSHEFRIPIPLRLPLRFLLSHGQRQLELQRPAGKNHRHHLGSRGGLQYLRLVQVSHLQKDEGEDRGGGR